MDELNFNYSSRTALNFAVFLLIYEITVYIANDMIMPGMLRVIHDFHGSDQDIASSLTAFILGGASLQLILGPLSDRYGRRPVLLFGVGFFVISSILIFISQNIGQFILGRFFQGMGLCFITVVGYATLQEIYTEISAIRLMTVMNGITILAPLLGPLLGALIIQYSNWRSVFLIITLLGVTSFVGIWIFMPETIGIKRYDGTINLSTPLERTILKNNFKALLCNNRFMLGSIAIAFLAVPMIAWIGTTPLILMRDHHLTVIQYALWQIPIFVSAIISNFSVRYLISHITPLEICKLGSVISTIGLFCMLPLYYIFRDDFKIIIIAMCFYAFGLSYVTSTLNRLTLYSTAVPKGTAAAVMSFFLMVITASGNAFANYSYNLGGYSYYILFCAACGAIYICLFTTMEYIRVRASLRQSYAFNNTVS